MGVKAVNRESEMGNRQRIRARAALLPCSASGCLRVARAPSSAAGPGQWLMH